MVFLVDNLLNLVSAKNVKSMVLPPSKLPRMVGKGNAVYKQQLPQDRGVFIIDSEVNKPSFHASNKPATNNPAYERLGGKMLSPVMGKQTILEMRLN